MRIVKLQIEVNEGTLRVDEKAKEEVCALDRIPLPFLKKIKKHIDKAVLKAERNWEQSE